MPIFSYFLVVGSILTGLLFYANTVIVLSPLPFGSQKDRAPRIPQSADVNTTTVLCSVAAEASGRPTMRCAPHPRSAL